ncbi:MAG: BrnA antitoxin family protein [Deltaproteobacteria bacterium]|nr:BrnA antitoxin family protein [Deltaproteobacteria bacterium]
MEEKEYDFSRAQQGKFYRPIEETELPVYLDKDVMDYFVKKAREKSVQPGRMINSILRKEMESSSSEKVI